MMLNLDTDPIDWTHSQNAVGALDGAEAIANKLNVGPTATDSKASPAAPGTPGYQKKPPTNGDTSSVPAKTPVTPSISTPSSSMAAKSVIEKQNSVSTTQISQAGKGQCYQLRGNPRYWATFDPQKMGAPQFAERLITCTVYYPY